MELKEFVSLSLCEIQEGVHEAIQKLKSSRISGAVNPVWSADEIPGRSHIQKVNFDVAVVVIEKTAGTIQGGIKVVGIGAQGEASTATETNSVSRIQFCIPVIPPVTTIHQNGGRE